MNLDIEKINTLVRDFIELNEKHQKEILGKIFLLQQQELIEEQNRDNPEFKKDKETFFINQMNKKINDAKNICETIKPFNHEQAAQVVAVMELLKPGSFTKKEEIKVSVQTKTIPLKQVLEQQFPDVDAETIIKKTQALMKQK